MHFVFTAVAAVLIFAVMIMIHEFGHFITAKLFGVRVNEFAVGMGPKLCAKQRGETLYSLRLIPLGGFCALEGEDTDSQDARSFSAQKRGVKLIILAAGAFMNILLGFLLLITVNAVGGQYVKPQVATVVQNGAAQAAGMEAGDDIISVNGKRVHIIQEFYEALSKNTDPNKTTVFGVRKANGAYCDITVTPAQGEEGSLYGISLAKTQHTALSVLHNSIYETSYFSRVIIQSFFDMIRGRVPVSDISGPVGIVSEIGSAVEQTRTLGLAGFLDLLYLTIVLTINLGIFNLLPIPALDGGRILFVLVEMIVRREIPKEKEAMVHFIGFALLIVLSVLIMFKDILTLRG